MCPIFADCGLVVGIQPLNNYNLLIVAPLPTSTKPPPQKKRVPSSKTHLELAYGSFSTSLEPRTSEVWGKKAVAFWFGANPGIETTIKSMVGLIYPPLFSKDGHPNRGYLSFNGGLNPRAKMQRLKLGVPRGLPQLPRSDWSRRSSGAGSDNCQLQEINVEV